MIEKFNDIEHKFIEIERKISDPEVIADQSAYQTLIKQHSELKEVVESLNTYKALSTEESDTKELLSDPEFKEMAEEELARIQSEMTACKDVLETFLLPKDPNDTKNAILEIRSGTGGEEAALFAYELYRMYNKYAETQGWKVEVISENMTGLGGIKEVIALVSGTNVFSYLKFESGTHRVQRVPETETSGRLHTSAATVAIMPEAEEVDVEIDTKDLRIDTYRASGAGGQHVNKTDSAIRITHIPSGVVVSCQDQRSQLQNKDKALRILRSRLYDLQEEERKKSNSDLRKYQVGSGDRSEKIRTYNFPQSRVTDHRINLTLYTLSDILEGKLGEIIQGLRSEEKLKKMNDA